MKKVLIIGATSAIAAAVAHKYGAEKYNLVLAGRDVEELEAMAGDLSLRHRVDVKVRAFDALAYDTHQAFFDACAADEDNGYLAGVILAYGYLPDQKAAEADFSEARKVIEINFTSCVSILEIAARYFEAQRTGFICVLSSVAGDRGRQSNYLYGSAKGGLSLYLQGLRNRLYPSNVKVITVKPGFVDTKMTFGLPGMFMVAKPEQVAERIYEAVRKGMDTVYAPAFWKYVMLGIKLTPERIFKKLKL